MGLLRRILGVPVTVQGMSWKWREKEEKQGLTVTLRDSGLCRVLGTMAHQQEVGGGPKSTARFTPVNS